MHLLELRSLITEILLHTYRCMGLLSGSSRVVDRFSVSHVLWIPLDAAPWSTWKSIFYPVLQRFAACGCRWPAIQCNSDTIHEQYMRIFIGDSKEKWQRQSAICSAISTWLNWTNRCTGLLMETSSYSARGPLRTFFYCGRLWNGPILIIYSSWWRYLLYYVCSVTTATTKFVTFSSQRNIIQLFHQAFRIKS